MQNLYFINFFNKAHAYIRYIYALKCINLSLSKRLYFPEYFLCNSPILPIFIGLFRVIYFKFL